MKRLLIIVLIFTALLACKEQAANTTQMQVTASDTALFTPAMVVNEKDYACGMPVTAGILDTCHYEGKAYGFCSAECKDAFMQDPKKYLATK